MGAILVSLIVAILLADSQTEMSIIEYWLFKAPLSLHAGWIVAAFVVNVNILVDWTRGSAAKILACAVASEAVVVSVVIVFTFVTPRPDPIIGFVAAWALSANYVDLKQATELKDPKRFHFIDWPQYVLDGIGMCSLALTIVCLVLAVVASVRRVSTSPKAALAEKVGV